MWVVRTCRRCIPTHQWKWFCKIFSSLNSSDLWKRSFDKSNENLYLLWSWPFHNLQSRYTTSFMTSKYSFETVFELLKFSNNVQCQNFERKLVNLRLTKIKLSFLRLHHTCKICLHTLWFQHLNKQEKGKRAQLCWFQSK